MTPATRRRPLAGIVAGLLSAILAACGPAPTPSPSATPEITPVPSVDAAAVYGTIAKQVEQIRGLQPTGDIAPVLLDADQLRANLTATFDKDNPPASIRETEALYQLLGLLPVGTSLRTAELDLLSGQVAGYYAPDKKQLFVVSRSGGIGPSQRVTYAHEFTHQLQDQHFDLTEMQARVANESDPSAALLCLIEGDAVSVQTSWTTENLTAADLAQLVADASDPAVVQSLLNAPPILRILSLAPYTEGQAFVSALQAAGGEAAVNKAFGDPPISTSQVLRPALYLSHTRPVPVQMPAGLAGSLGTGWTDLAQDTLGELFIRSWLQASGASLAVAATAAQGDAGDRVELLAGPSNQLALAMILTWETPDDQAEFLSAWDQVRGKVLGANAATTQDGRGVVVVIAPTEAGVQKLLTGFLAPVQAF